MFCQILLHSSPISPISTWKKIRYGWTLAYAKTCHIRWCVDFSHFFGMRSSTQNASKIFWGRWYTDSTQALFKVVDVTYIEVVAEFCQSFESTWRERIRKLHVLMKNYLRSGTRSGTMISLYFSFSFRLLIKCWC